MRPIRDIGLFTDGLQMLCLKYAERAVHEPFFMPMFRSLRVRRQVRFCGTSWSRFSIQPRSTGEQTTTRLWSSRRGHT